MALEIHAVCPVCMPMSYVLILIFNYHDKPASGFSRGVDKSADAQQKRRHQESSHNKLLHVRVMRSLSLRNLIREGSWISCPATPDALSSEAFSGLAPETDPCRHLHNWSAFWLRVQSPVRPNPYAPGTPGYAQKPQTSASEVGGLSLDRAWSGRPR